MNKVNRLSTLSRASAAAIASFAVAGCGGNAASPQGAVTIVPPSSAKLQIAVGTANLFGTTTGLNVVSTLRTPAGKSVLVSTPTLTGPFVLPPPSGTPDSTGATIASGPSAGEVNAGGTISGHVQVAAGTPASEFNATTFGIRGGVFADGFQPSNANDRGTTFLSPYIVPAYDNGDDNAFVPIGGPPAYDPNGKGQGTRDGTFDASVPGVIEGITPFAGVTVNPGAYNLSVLIPSNGTVQTTLTASTTIETAPLLPVVAPPTFVPDGNGGGTFDVTLPPGVTEGLINIEDLGPDATAKTQPINCYLNGTYPAYFTVHVTASGTQTLPDNDGVGTAPSSKSAGVFTPTICTAAQNTAANGGTATDGDSYTVQFIGTDYPLLGFNTLFTPSTALPTITGAAGTDDITISPIGGSADLFASGKVRSPSLLHKRMLGRPGLSRLH